MNTDYTKWYSPALSRDMECKVWGHAGRPVLFVPCQDGRFFDFENFGMADVWRPWIDRGDVMVFSVDTIDRETWSDRGRSPRWRSCLYEQWISYICDEVVPFMRQRANECNGWTGVPFVIVCGSSLGAAHAANLFFRRPDLFDGLMALSGIYTAEYGFDDYMDDLVYRNSPVHYLADLPPDHANIALYNMKKIAICTGQGPWEMPDATKRLEHILKQKGINAWVDYWGYDCSHDWYWWYRQTEYFLPWILGQ